MAPSYSSPIDHRFSSLVPFSFPPLFLRLGFLRYLCPKVYTYTGNEGKKKRKILLHAVAAGMLVLCWVIPIGLHKQRPVSVKQDKS